jgi:hypothetical protein
MRGNLSLLPVFMLLNNCAATQAAIRQICSSKNQQIGLKPNINPL